MNLDNGIIYVDVDGVLANWVQGLLSRINEAHGTSYVHDDWNSWDASIVPKGKKWWDYTSDREFWQHLPLYPWARELFMHAKVTGMPMAFLSSLPVKTPDVLEARREWLDEHMQGLWKWKPSEHLISANKKELVVHAGDLLIDDSPTNVNAVRNIVGAEVWCLAQPWNRGITQDRLSPNVILHRLEHLRKE